MSSSSPPILPMSATPSSAQSAPSLLHPSPSPTSALRRFLSRLSDSLRRSLANRRPWSELLDRSSFSVLIPSPTPHPAIRRNIPYFRTNYLAFLLLALAASLLSHPFSLLVLLLLLAAWSLLYLFRPPDQPLVLLGRTFSDRETLSALVLITFLVVFLTSVGSVLISALTVGAVVVCAHGAFRMPEDLFLDDQETTGAGTGLMSFLGSTAGPCRCTSDQCGRICRGADVYEGFRNNKGIPQQGF